MRCKQERLSQVDVEDALAHNHVHDKAVDCPSNKDVRVEAVGRGLNVDITVREELKLSFAAATSSIHGEKNRPCNAQVDKADRGANSEETHEQVGVETLMLQGEVVGDLPESTNPVEKSGRKGRCSLPRTRLAITQAYTELIIPYCSRKEPK